MKFVPMVLLSIIL